MTTKLLDRGKDGTEYVKTTVKEVKEDLNLMRFARAISFEASITSVTDVEDRCRKAWLVEKSRVDSSDPVVLANISSSIVSLEGYSSISDIRRYDEVAIKAILRGSPEQGPSNTPIIDVVECKLLLSAREYHEYTLIS